VHGSPTSTASGSIGTHRTAFQVLAPSSAYGMHFSPRGQSWSQTEHCTAGPAPDVLLLVSSIDEDAVSPVLATLPVVSPTLVPPLDADELELLPVSPAAGGRDG
jgi:hypothetical protein